MRGLTISDLKRVVGAGGTRCCETKTRNNNGYGNGAQSGPRPAIGATIILSSLAGTAAKGRSPGLDSRAPRQKAAAD